MEEPDVIIVCWYRAEEYAAVRLMAADIVRMEKTFHEWKTIADEAFAQFAADGYDIRKVDFDHAAFLRWASARKVDSTYETRLEWCREIFLRN